MAKSKRRWAYQGRGTVLLVDMEVSVNGGAPKWLVYVMEIPIKMDHLGARIFLGNLHIWGSLKMGYAA